MPPSTSRLTITATCSVLGVSVLLVFVVWVTGCALLPFPCVCIYVYVPLVFMGVLDGVWELGIYSRFINWLCIISYGNYLSFYVWYELNQIRLRDILNLFGVLFYMLMVYDLNQIRHYLSYLKQHDLIWGLLVGFVLCHLIVDSYSSSFQGQRSCFKDAPGISGKRQASR